MRHEEALYFFYVYGENAVTCACGKSEAFLNATDEPDGECDNTWPENYDETCGGDSSYELCEIPEYLTCEYCTRDKERRGEWASLITPALVACLVVRERCWSIFI